MVSEARATEVRELLERMWDGAARRPDVVAVGLAGSWACGDARMDSDVDLMILTTMKILSARAQELYREPNIFLG